MMLMIPSIAISLATFPGVIVRQATHQLFCRLLRLAVFDIRYLRLEEPAGYVQHEPPKTIFQHLLIGLGPFVTISVLGTLIGIFAINGFRNFHGNVLIFFFLVWLGVCIAANAFPNVEEAKRLWKEISSHRATIWSQIFGGPLAGLVYLGSLGSYFWADVAYGILVAIGLPFLILFLLA